MVDWNFAYLKCYNKVSKYQNNKTDVQSAHIVIWLLQSFILLLSVLADFPITVNVITLKLGAISAYYIMTKNFHQIRLHIIGTSILKTNWHIIFYIK